MNNHTKAIVLAVHGALIIVRFKSDKLIKQKIAKRKIEILR